MESKVDKEHQEEYYKAYYAANRERLKQYQKEYRQSNKEKLLQYHKEYREEHGARRSNYSTQWNKEHQEHRQQYLQQYYEENREEILQRQSLYYSEQGDLVREYQRGYKKRFPEKVRALDHKRRARQAQSGGSFTHQEWAELKVFYGNVCLCCGKKEPQVKLCADHVIPISKRGASNIDNIQPLCRSCNSKKRDKIIDYRTTYKGGSRV